MAQTLTYPLIWVTDIETIAPWGLCEADPPGSDLDESIQKHTATVFNLEQRGYLDPGGLRGFGFEWNRGVGTDREHINGNLNPTYALTLDYTDSVAEFVRRTYDLPDDTEVLIDNPFSISTGSLWNQPRFQDDETAQQQAEFQVDQGPNPIVTYRDGNCLLQMRFRQEVHGVWVSRRVDIIHEGDSVSLYTIPDFISYWGGILGVDNPFVITGSYNLPDGHGDYDADLTGFPGYDCPTSIKATVFNLDDAGASSTITVSADYQSSPGDSSITIIDGDAPSTMIENGDGSVTIHDNGNIIMSNDGGTFFLNEFGNVGFYANNDASLTANAQVQLGVGGTSVTVENDCFTFRDATGNVELTADELSRLKELLGD